jgi:hypothetical protein
VRYADVLGVTDHFKFELYIMVKQGAGFPFVLFKTWEFDDIDNIDDGADGVVDFVLGNCNFPGNTVDFVFPPWQNLPVSTNVHFAYVGNIPGNNQYWDVTFNSYTPAGPYDLPAPVVTMDGWCGDLGTTIAPGTYNALVFSSLNDANWIPTMPVTLAEMAKVNWLMNHLGDYGINIGDDTGLDGGVVQQAIWIILNGASYGPPASTMAADAALYGNGFVPLPGGWAAVLLVAENPANPGVYVYQLIFVIVDP